MKRTKQLIFMFIVGLFILGMTSAKSVFADTTITGFDITLSESNFPYPVLGEASTRDLNILKTAINNAGSSAGFTAGESASLYWSCFNPEDSSFYFWCYFDNSKIFEENTQYYISFTLRANTGYRFSQNYPNSYLLNGQTPAFIESYGSYVVLSYAYGDVTGSYIDSVQISGAQIPAIGTDVDWTKYALKIPKNSGYMFDSAASFAWIITDHVPLDYNDLLNNGSWYYSNSVFPTTFEEGYYYTICAALLPTDGNQFKDLSELSGSINNAEANFAYESGYSGLIVYYTYDRLMPELSIPRLSSVKNSAKGVKLSWEASSDNIDGYQIYRRTDGAAYEKVKTIKSASTNTWTDTSAVDNGTNYRYRIKTYHTVPGTTVKSEYSNYIDTYYLSTVTTLRPLIANTGIKLRWQKNTAAAGYYIYRSENGADYEYVKKITSGSTVSWGDTEANMNGAKYEYRLVAYQTVGSVTYKSAKSSAAAYFITRPTIKSISNTGASQLTVTWEPNKKANGYLLQYSTDASFSNEKTVKIEGKATANNVIKGLKTGKKYYFRMRSYKTVSGTTYYSKWTPKKSYLMSN